MPVYLIAIIIGIYAIGGFIDFFFKERAKHKLGWANIPNIYHHPQWPIVVWSVMGSLFIGGYFLFGYWQIFLGLILFWYEDLFYYIFTWMWYKTYIPKTLNWLNFFNWSGEKLTKKEFIGAVYIQTAIFIAVISFVGVK